MKRISTFGSGGHKRFICPFPQPSPCPSKFSANDRNSQEKVRLLPFRASQVKTENQISTQPDGKPKELSLSLLPAEILYHISQFHCLSQLFLLLSTSYFLLFKGQWINELLNYTLIPISLRTAWKIIFDPQNAVFYKLRHNSINLATAKIDGMPWHCVRDCFGAPYHFTELPTFHFSRPHNGESMAFIFYWDNSAWELLNSFVSHSAPLLTTLILYLPKFPRQCVPMTSAQIPPELIKKFTFPLTFLTATLKNPLVQRLAENVMTTSESIQVIPPYRRVSPDSNFFKTLILLSEPIAASRETGVDVGHIGDGDDDVYPCSFGSSECWRCKTEINNQCDQCQIMDLLSDKTQTILDDYCV